MITVTNFGNGVDGVYEIPKEIEVPYVAVKPMTQAEKPFAVVDPSGSMISFDLELTHESAQSFVDGDNNPINTTCFIIISLLDKLYKLADEHEDIESFKKTIQTLTF